MPSEACFDVEIRNVPKKLLEDFDKAIKHRYPGGRSEAVRDLMQKFVRENKEG